MAFIIHAFPIPQIPVGIPRSSVIPVVLPTGSQVCGIMQGDQPALIVRGDVAQPNTTFNFVVVRSDVTLQTAEETAVYVGSITGYRTSAGLEIYHILRLP
jgi:hypothetical protein